MFHHWRRRGAPGVDNILFPGRLGCFWIKYGSCAPPTGQYSPVPPTAAAIDSHNNAHVIMAENETLECITEHERILQEIESTDTACVGPTLR